MPLDDPRSYDALIDLLADLLVEDLESERLEAQRAGVLAAADYAECEDMACERQGQSVHISLDKSLSNAPQILERAEA